LDGEVKAGVNDITIKTKTALYGRAMNWKLRGLNNDSYRHLPSVCVT